MKKKVLNVPVPVEIDLETIDAALQKTKELRNAAKEAAQYSQEINFSPSKIQWIILGISIFSLIISFISFLNK